ncbi:MAG: hypothetical protein ACR2IJ_02255, partial [Fluviibacter sp.]
TGTMKLCVWYRQYLRLSPIQRDASVAYLAPPVPLIKWARGRRCSNCARQYAAGMAALWHNQTGRYVDARAGHDEGM